ncbi:hypothetical protein [Oceanobacillus oncorhynchi]|uniref:hypothetical protein n=1 Tax=Oceanobacillus oncorhynchi TaxID=545501 RepID=UPI00186806BD|nr:hypothetical protein [Oceanobacillus oncorhynchi]
MFIELTTGNGKEVLVNINQIEGIEPAKRGKNENTLIGLNSQEGIFVQETYESIKGLLECEGKMV